MRITVEVIQSGQKRPYADTTRHVRITFEAWSIIDKEWVPNQYIKEEDVRGILPHLYCGWTDFDYDKAEHTQENYFRTRLDWLEEKSPGVWEFHTTSPYTG